MADWRARPGALWDSHDDAARLWPFIQRMRELTLEHGPEVWAPFDDPASTYATDDGLLIHGRPPCGATSTTDLDASAMRSMAQAA
jgi:hypothetical protein